MKAAENVGCNYYKTPSNNLEKQQNRKQIFCYELYHRMRQLQDNHCKELTLNGELDKSGRAVYNDGKPDFLFHVSGTDSFNEAVIEVKNTLHIKEVKEDIQKINAFIKGHEYKIGILFVYDHALPTVKKFINAIRELDTLESKDSIFVIVAKDPWHIKAISLSEITGA
jgi:hypothetical protein